MIRLPGLVALALALSGIPVAAPAQSVLYINHAPDVRYSADGLDSRIGIDLEKDLYGYGHDYGRVLPCAGDKKKCIAVDFMALAQLPADIAVGTKFSTGAWDFEVSRQFRMSIAGGERDVLRVDVRKEGSPSNAYLYDSELGVLAVIVLNFENERIPESIFLLSGPAGVFPNEKSADGKTPKG